MRTLAVAGLCLVLSGCSSAGGGDEDPQVTFSGTVTARSMEPTLMVGDHLTAVRAGASGPEVGDVVVYTDPGGWLAGTEGEGQLVHRVIGSPGDTVTCCDADGRLSVNGSVLDEDYLAPREGRCDAPLIMGSPSRTCDWQIGPVPDGSLFVLGDNRERSADSRFHMCPAGRETCGTSPWVPIDLVRGVVQLP